MLMAKVSGKSYYNFVGKNVYKAAGMINSGSEPESVEVANRSKGYMREQFEMVSNEPTLPGEEPRRGAATRRRAI